MELVGLEPTTSCMPRSLAEDLDKGQKAWKHGRFRGLARSCGLAAFTGVSPEFGHWPGDQCPNGLRLALASERRNRTSGVLWFVRRGTPRLWTRALASGRKQKRPDGRAVAQRARSGNGMCARLARVRVQRAAQEVVLG
jgi:hypothetical protein